MEEDLELKLIEARKMAEMRKRMKASAHTAPKEEEKKKTSKEIVLEVLYDRGDEVLNTAYSYYPRETELIVEQLARLIREGKLRERISGGELYGVFRNVGLRFSLHTTIKVQEKGKLVDLAEKLRKKDDQA